jgi:hypothetical protein
LERGDEAAVAGIVDGPGAARTPADATLDGATGAVLRTRGGGALADTSDVALGIANGRPIVDTGTDTLTAPARSS